MIAVVTHSKEDLMLMQEAYLQDKTVLHLNNLLVELYKNAKLENGNVKLMYGIGFLITKYIIVREIFIYQHRAYPALFKYDINDDMGFTKTETERIKKQLLINSIVPEI